jgi:hypothetical protein
VGDFADQFAFCCIRVSKKYAGSTPEGRYSSGWISHSGDCMDVDAFYGNSLTGQFRKLTDKDLFNHLNNYTTDPYYRTTAKNVPAIEGFTNRGTNPNNTTHFTVFGAQVQQWHINNCYYDWDPSAGVLDEFRMYERVLSDSEIFGLFALGCGSQPHTQACDQIYSNMVGAGLTAADTAEDQLECGGADPYATINDLI